MALAPTPPPIRFLPSARSERNGPKVLFVLTNPGFRNTDASNEALTRAVEESFPT